MKVHNVHSRDLAEARVARWRGKLPAVGAAPAPELSARMDRLARIASVLVPTTLAALAALHAAWALGWRWPGGTDREFAKRLLSKDERERLVALRGTAVPPASATWAVAAALLLGGGTVRVAGTGAASRAVRVATWGVSGVFLARGVLFIPGDLIGGLDEPYERLDLGIYSPLCLALGAGTAIVARSASATSRPGAAGPGDPAASPAVGHGGGR